MRFPGGPRPPNNPAVLGWDSRCDSIPDVYKWVVFILEAVRMRTQGSGCGERGEDEGVTWEPCFTGRVISEDRDSVCRT